MIFIEAFGLTYAYSYRDDLFLKLHICKSAFPFLVMVKSIMKGIASFLLNSKFLLPSTIIFCIFPSGNPDIVIILKELGYSVRSFTTYIILC